ncbi:winged helix DNA-binding protein [Sneathiella sp.]|uniref:MarR family winged helix-turn-helix transcriptional regulator n=1 Tax=Sneathiella sp. TaxID=1964365 RepID=UPI002635F2A4|nr:winged helix DNA-binding protein [Sneathiella sp.]MDF2365982.1 winged helix DNA-binding protein [Sneathiella sp.]
MTEDYHELTRLIERLHRRFLDVLRTELTLMEITDINAVQALLLANIGDEEINVRELMSRGYYQGSNASYNLKKLVEMGYLLQEKSERDRRATMIKLSEKGLDMVEKLAVVEQKQSDLLARSNPAPDVAETRKHLRQIERIWTDYIQYGTQ